MIILGLDPGLARTGYGLLNTKQSQIFVSCGCLTTKPILSTADRLLQLGQDLSVLIKQYRPDVAVIEQIFFNTNTSTAMLTAQARGVFSYLLRFHHVPVYSLTPLQIKSQITGFGHADKKQVQQAIQGRLHLNNLPQPDDAADALAAALCLVDNKYQLHNISA
ncbi:MAG: crossover junction endodeoxyribonuclease RuvC [Candidatus Andersenbacteria bacterium RIFCSPHIGHO2_12_FULL_46_9]|nr:MAG: Crossover junction endodeoxyribonuclease RuvC [Parcubacteria group bacterium GW2011_GWA2_45_14]OGY35707.1 MAG: crossover junction endodeoxyribonuclease RuvC [Candidatus Andersenbacteria bacterium RIFCSPHIGHO2_12_FULL_46_9]OGY35768.1 MAG: crossover junction endodeoxyribonuclease RuvC [Candidatus Andersenbacteria bacterium RIFCSPHIGHO2_02_FULL_46_16]OGY38161.1 MAG: crossover junction endodeoxyribonuclease RuvC [Candidatus Andersenbacteria bacterium RIFCSPLOWO2_12_FULL_45_8]HBE90173.1 cros